MRKRPRTRSRRPVSVKLATICARRARLAVQSYLDGREPDLITAIAMEIARAKLEPRAVVRRTPAKRKKAAAGGRGKPRHRRAAKPKLAFVATTKNTPPLGWTPEADRREEDADLSILRTLSKTG